MTFVLLLLFAVLLTVIACNGVTVTTENGTLTITPVDSGAKEDTTTLREQNLSGEDASTETDAEQHQAQGKEGTGAEEAAPCITTIDALIRNYPTQAKTLGDKIAKAIIKKYNFQDAIFCGYSFDDADEQAQVSGIAVKIAVKEDEIERKHSQYKVTFDPIILDDIANETAALKNAKVSFVSFQTYDAKEKQNDQEFLSSLYDQDDFVYIDYEKEVFEEPPLTIQELISEYGDVINASLQTHYENVLKRAFGRNYLIEKDEIETYQWDLGEVNENNEIQQMKLSFIWKSSDSTRPDCNLYSYNVILNSPININDLTNSTKLSSTTASYSQKYFFSYNYSIQGTRTELVNAALQYMLDNEIAYDRTYEKIEGTFTYIEHDDLTDLLQSLIEGEYNNNDIRLIFKVIGGGLSSELGNICSWTLMLITSDFIDAISFSVQSSIKYTYVEKIQQGCCDIIPFNREITYSDNLLPKVMPN